MAISTKINWQDGETVYAADLNRIENNIKEMNTALSGKATLDSQQTVTGQWSFQHSSGTKFRKSISSIWYETRLLPLDVIINGENSAGLVFNRGGTDLAQMVFNQHGVVLRVLASNTKHTLIHTGNLELISATAPAALEE